MASLRKNTASQKVTFALVSATTGAALTSATFTSLAWVTVDGVQSGFAGTFTTLGNGQFQYAPTQSETNGVDIGILITPAGAVPVNLDFHTDDPTVAQSGVNVVNYNNQTAQTDANNLPKVDMEAINGATIAAIQLALSTQSICSGSIGNGSTTTSYVVGALSNPASLTDNGQLIGRTIIFLGVAGNSGHVQAQATNITGSTTGATPTISSANPLTSAPVSGDKFVVL